MLPSPEIIILMLLIFFSSAFIRSTFGFGDAVIAMPLLSLIISLKIATPLVALTATTLAAFILAESWRQADFKAAWRLILSALIGTPLGIWILRAAPETIVKSILGVVLIAYGLYNLLNSKLLNLKSDRWAYLFGFIAGVLGGAYNTNGPPVVIYGTLRHWPPEKFRATLQGFFLPAGGFIVVGHAVGGLWTAPVLKLYAFMFPMVLLGIFLGGKANRRFSAARFTRVLYWILIVLGAMLIFFSGR